MSERTQFPAYITKYALTRGIYTVLVEDNFNISPTMVSAVRDGWQEHYHINDWWRTHEKAVKRAEAMRAAKIASARKQIARLESLAFT